MISVRPSWLADDGSYVEMPLPNEIGPLSAEGDGVFVLNLFVKGLDDRIYWKPVQL